MRALVGVSGSLVRVDGAGGESVRRWRDTQLNVDCTFAAAGDGQLRCLPLFGTAFVYSHVFPDAACTQGAVLVSSTVCGGTLRHGVAYDGTVCPARRRIYDMTGPFPQTQVFYKSGASCVASTLDPTAVLYALGNEVPPGDFVSGTLSNASGRIALSTITAADGATGPAYDLRDQQLGISCWAITRADGSVQCLPTQTAFATGWFAEATCSSPAYWTSGCPPDFAAQSGSGTACVADTEYFTVGAPLTSRYRSGSMCTQEAVPSGEQSYAAGSAMPAASFATATVTTTSLGRLERRLLEWPGGMRMVGGWRDTQLDADCSSYDAWDGSKRCVPEQAGVYVSAYFSDAQCSQPLVQLANTATSCSPRYALFSVDYCQSRARVLGVGARYSGQVYLRGGTTCQAVTLPSSYLLFLTTGEIPPAQFAPLNDTLR